MITVAEEVFSELDHPSLSDRIHDLIKERIIRHELAPGTRLLELDIAAELGVSRTPVRAAVTRLAAAGLVKVVPRRGVFVTKPSAKDIVDLYEVREALEVLAVRLASTRLTNDDISAMEDGLERFKAELDDSEYLACFELDREFHDRLVELSGNEKLLEVYKLISGNIQVTRWIHCKERARQEASLREHRAILGALAKGDISLACDAVRNHLHTVKRDLLDNSRQSA